MRGALRTAVRRCPSTPAADGDLERSSPRSGEFRVGAAFAPARATVDPVGSTEFVVPGLRAPSATPSTPTAPRPAALSGGATGGGVPVSVGGATADGWFEG